MGTETYFALFSKHLYVVHTEKSLDSLSLRSLLIRSTLFLALACKKISYFKVWPNWTTLLANMSIMLVEWWSIFHVVLRSGQIGQHCSPTNSIRHKFSTVYVVLAAV